MMMMMMRINSDHVSTSMPYIILEYFKWANNCSFWSAFCGESRYTCCTLFRKSQVVLETPISKKKHVHRIGPFPQVSCLSGTSGDLKWCIFVSPTFTILISGYGSRCGCAKTSELIGAKFFSTLSILTPKVRSYFEGPTPTENRFIHPFLWRDWQQWATGWYFYI